MAIHDDTEEECDLKQFKRFLCKTPLSMTVKKEIFLGSWDT